MNLDPTTFAILRSSFINIANEMGLTLGKVAYSPVITEGRDFAGAVYDADGHLVACGEHDLTGVGEGRNQHLAAGRIQLAHHVVQQHQGAWPAGRDERAALGQ